jgi:hypothetical protein
MFEKVPAARMNNRANSSTEQLIATERKRHGKHTSHQPVSHFPSYLRLFDNFFEPLISESHWGAARLSAGCCAQFVTAQAHVAFL